jgi:protein translocase SecG subunit
MNYFLNIAQIILAVLLIATILMQSRGSGVSSLFGGGDNIYRAKRGAEKFLHYLTIVCSIIFMAIALTQLFF